MKVVFISNNLPPAVDGVGDYTYFIAEQFVEHGHEVHVICSDSKEIDVTQMEDISVYPIVDKWDRLGIDKAIKCIQEIQPDWVSLQYVPYSFSPKGQPWAMIHFAKQVRKLGVPLSTTFHEVCIRYEPRQFSRALSQRIIARALARHSQKNITSIDFYVFYLKQWTKEVRMIQIGSNIPAIYTPEEDQKELRQSITSDGEFLIATFGKRDHVALLNLFEQLVSIRPNTKLLICGKTPKIKIKEQLKSNIHSTGYLSREGVFQYLKCSDLFLQFSMGKGGVCNKSGSLAAAFAAGLPIVGNKGDMTNQSLVESGAVIFAPKKGRANLDALLEIIDNPVLLEQQAERAELYHERFLDWRTIYEEYIEYWN
ncbi:MAG: glycosyltransferase family 4 protein [Bacteroidota bacterium]